MYDYIIYIYIYIFVNTEKCLAEVHFIGHPCWQAPSAVSEGDKNTSLGHIRAVQMEREGERYTSLWSPN